MEETRLDRIERYLAEFIQGMKEERAAFAEERKAITELRESRKKTDEQLRRTDEQLAETSKKIDDTGDLPGKLGIIDGKVAEDLFYRNVRHVFRQKDIAFSDVRRNVKKKGISGEYDIVAVGENRILVVVMLIFLIALISESGLKDFRKNKRMTCLLKQAYAPSRAIIARSVPTMMIYTHFRFSSLPVEKQSLF